MTEGWSQEPELGIKPRYPDVGVLASVLTHGLNAQLVAGSCRLLPFSLAFPCGVDLCPAALPARQGGLCLHNRHSLLVAFPSVSTYFHTDSFSLRHGLVLNWIRKSAYLGCMLKTVPPASTEWLPAVSKSCTKIQGIRRWEMQISDWERNICVARIPVSCLRPGPQAVLRLQPPFVLVASCQFQHHHVFLIFIILAEVLCCL